MSLTPICTTQSDAVVLAPHSLSPWLSPRRSYSLCVSLCLPVSLVHSLFLALCAVSGGADDAFGAGEPSRHGAPVLRPRGVCDVPGPGEGLQEQKGEEIAESLTG